MSSAMDNHILTTPFPLLLHELSVPYHLLDPLATLRVLSRTARETRMPSAVESGKLGSNEVGQRNDGTINKLETTAETRSNDPNLDCTHHLQGARITFQAYLYAPRAGRRIYNKLKTYKVIVSEVEVATRREENL